MSGKWILGKAAAVMAAAAMAVTALPVVSYAAMNYSEFGNDYSYSTEMRGLSAFQIVNDMGPGWNLGNSLESDYNENYWGNPTTTKAMIDKLAAKGYTTLRVPVRWDDNYSDASKYTISSSYMDRVETVVNYGLANDMYVILNVHHNDLQHKVPDTEAISAELSAVWKQIGERFINYGDKLIFEVNNEPRSGDDWTGNAAYYESVNKCNEAARAAIRATGGNNTERLIMLPTYCASGDADKAAAWTKNAGDDMIAVSIHAYLPYDFAFNSSGHTDWTEGDIVELKAFFNRQYNYFISKGIPVVIGEFGTQNKNNTAAREKHATLYGQLARQFAEQDIPCVVWDNNCFYTNGENFGLFDRNSQTFTFSGVVENLIAAYEGDPVYETSVPETTILSSGGSSSNWGQAVNLSSSIVTDMKSNQQICVKFTSSNNPELILSDYGTDKNWVKINPDSVSNGVATWSYNTLYSAFGYTFDGLDNVAIGDTGTSLTVTSVYMNNPNAHTHNYNGSVETTLEATATTKGRQIVHCSVSGCEEYRVLVTEWAETPTAAMFTFTPPADLEYDGKAKTATVTVKPGITGMGAITVKYYDEKGSVLSAAPIEPGTYTVKIDVAKGSSYSAAYGLVVGSFTIEEAAFEITSQPVDYTGKIGDTAKFTVEATGAKSYQWYQNTGSGWVAINTSAGRSKSISISVAAFRVGFRYYCAVSDGTKTINTNEVSIKLDETLAITSQPVDYVGAIGDTAKFTVEATGATSYQWYQNTGSGWVAMNTTAGRSKSISVSVVEFRVGFRYKCVISDGTNTLTSDEAEIKLDETLAITSQPVNYAGKIGDTAVFTIGTTGVKYYQWQQNTGSGWVNINTSAGRSNTLSIQIAAFRIGYRYRCVISDGTKTIVSDAVQMVMAGELAITGQPTDYVGTIGGNATFTVEATGATSYQWYQNTGSGWVAINTTAGRSNTLTIPIAAFRVGFQYRCEVSDGTSTITSEVAEILI